MNLTHSLRRLMGISACALLFSTTLNAQITSYPYLEDFENYTILDWTASGGTWVLGDPNKAVINAPFSGDTCWVTGLTGCHGDGEQVNVMSPEFDFTDLERPVVKLMVWWEFENGWDGANLEYSTNGGSTWTLLGDATGDTCVSKNWYVGNANGMTFPRTSWTGNVTAAICETSGCAGVNNGSGGWVEASHCIGELAGESSVHFRVRVGAGTQCHDDGFAFDDFRIESGEQLTGDFDFECTGANLFSFTALGEDCVNDYTWNFGDPASGFFNTSTAENPGHAFQGTGPTFEVELIINGPCNNPDTITKTVDISGPPAEFFDGEDTVVCGAASLTLDPATVGDEYMWSTGEMTTTIDVTTDGDYWVDVTKNCITVRDSLEVTFAPFENATITPAGPFCSDDVPVDLSAVDPGGVWSGSGITDAMDGTFDPAIAGVGMHTITYGIESACGDTQTVDITVIQSQDASILTTGPFCEADPLDTLLALEPGGTWTGTGIVDQTVGSFSPSTAGPGLHVIVYSQMGACADTQFVNLAVVAEADATIDVAGPFCESDVAADLTAVTPGGVWSGTGIADAALGTFDPQLAGPGTHTITYGIAISCGDTQSIDIVVNPDLNASIDAAGPFCIASPSVDLTAFDPGGTWSGDGIVDASNGTFDPATAGTGSHVITYGIEDACGDTQQTVVDVIENFDASIAAAGPFCANGVAITLLAADAGGSWSGDGITNAINGTFNPALAGDGTHTITYAIEGLCGDTQSVEVIVNALPGITANPEEETILLGEEIELSASGAQNYQWTPQDYLIGCDTCDMVTSSPPVDIVYYVTGTDGNGCSNIDSVKIFVVEPDLFIANAITPNGDENNDTWTIDGLDEYPNNVVRIFTRNGTQIFEESPYMGNWNGNWEGKQLPAGAYFYLLDLGNGAELMRGTITLMRQE